MGFDEDAKHRIRRREARLVSRAIIDALQRKISGIRMRRFSVLGGGQEEIRPKN